MFHIYVFVCIRSTLSQSLRSTHSYTHKHSAVHPLFMVVSMIFLCWCFLCTPWPRNNVCVLCAWCLYIFGNSLRKNHKYLMKIDFPEIDHTQFDSFFFRSVFHLSSIFHGLADPPPHPAVLFSKVFPFSQLPFFLALLPRCVFIIYFCSERKKVARWVLINLRMATFK